MATHSGNTGRKCGKILRCHHPCLEKAGTAHIHICNRKWEFNPGCHHWVSGKCSDFTNLRLWCAEPCGKILGCGHLCSEFCSSFKCSCYICSENGPSSDEAEGTFTEEEESSGIITPPPSLASEVLEAGGGPEEPEIELPQHQSDQEQMLGSSPDGNNQASPDADDSKFFLVCVNQHVFPYEDERCPVCQHDGPFEIFVETTDESGSE